MNFTGGSATTAQPAAVTVAPPAKFVGQVQINRPVMLRHADGDGVFRAFVNGLTRDDGEGVLHRL